ncbi:hypothetical protein JOB18_014560 [Solea senegalensis]|uniref:Uncharacterized protein n=1 Tax=Solea senegalensis TaxID=28829 RepID=A0AAV6S516_SOLSE|nr:hypothetical protein JOB18_014560 [Solea senegalensis]
MTSHRGKSGKRDDTALTMEAISELLGQHRQSLADDFKTSFNQLENKFDEHGQRLSSLELAADDLSQRVGFWKGDASISAPGQRPRPVILCLHRYQIKDLLIHEARRRGKLEYRGQQIRVVEDYSPDVQSQRAEYRAVMADLYNRGLKPSLLYPARLSITLPSGDKKWLRCRGNTSMACLHLFHCK